MRKRTLVVIGLLLAVGLLGHGGMSSASEEPEPRTRALGFHMGAQVRFLPGLEGEDGWIDPQGVLFAQIGWDSPWGGVEFGVPADLTLLGSELTLEAFLPISRSWRFGTGLVFRPVAIELHGVRIVGVGTSDVVSFAVGGVITGKALDRPLLGLQPFMALRVNPW